jgi:hypothetical protein
VSLAHALTPERANVVARPLAGDPMWVRQRLLWPLWSPLAGHAQRLRDALSGCVTRSPTRTGRSRESPPRTVNG